MKKHYSIVRKNEVLRNKGLTENTLSEYYRNSKLMLKCVCEDGTTCYASPGVKGWIRCLYHGIKYDIEKRIGLAE